MTWAPRSGHTQCLRCGTSERRHAGKGFCDICIVVNRYQEDKETRERVKAYQANYREEQKALDPEGWKEKQKKFRNENIERHGMEPRRASSQLNYQKKRSVEIILHDAKFVPINSIEIAGMRTNIKPTDPLAPEKEKVFKEVYNRLKS